jgi:hypothetical protein
MDNVTGFEKPYFGPLDSQGIMETPAVYLLAAGSGSGSSGSFPISRPLEGTRHAIPSII